VAQKSPTREELTRALAARVATVRHARHERYAHLLRLALRTRIDNGYSAERLEDVVQQADDELAVLTEAVGGRIIARRRPKQLESSETCTVFVDECGSHTLKAKEPFKAFSLAAVIIRDSVAREVDRKWKRWKRDYLGSADKLVHEPDIRRGRSSFWCDGDSAQRARAVATLESIIDRLDFAGVVCVLDRPAYVAEWGLRPPDASLPNQPYVMMLHFLVERLAMVLHEQFAGARGRMVLESRGPLEDASMQYEFARLFLDGTSYVSATWFRQQFLPGISFMDKEENTTGLQLADLLARPCAEKVLEPSSTPARWLAFKKKLCPGIQTAHSILGLKVVPWDEQYDDIWKS
jgi:hypothetical protein